MEDVQLRTQLEKLRPTGARAFSARRSDLAEPTRDTAAAILAFAPPATDVMTVVKARVPAPAPMVPVRAAAPEQMPITGTIIRPETRASNAPSNTTNFYINGIWSTDEDARVGAQRTANVLGAPLEIIRNRTEGRLRDGTNVTLGALSTSLGHRMEREATDAMMRRVLEEVRAGRKVCIHAHSQGCVITSTAFTELMTTLSPAEWNRVKANVTIHCFGSPINRWPAGLDVVAFRNGSDRIARVSSASSWAARHTGRALQWGAHGIGQVPGLGMVDPGRPLPFQTVSPLETRGRGQWNPEGSHYPADYFTTDRIADFVIQARTSYSTRRERVGVLRWRTVEETHVDGAALARDLSRHARNGTWSDDVVQEVISRRRAAGDTAFMRQLYETEAPRGRDGAHRIGSFTLPAR